MRLKEILKEKGFSSSNIEKILVLSKEKYIFKGEIYYSEGNIGEDILIILEGEAEYKFDYSFQNKGINLVRRGEMLGFNRSLRLTFNESSDLKYPYSLNLLKDTLLVKFSIKELLAMDLTYEEVLNLLKVSALEAFNLTKRVVRKENFSNEEIILELLKDNLSTGMKVKDIAYITNIHLRTIQKTLKKMLKEGKVVKDQLTYYHNN